MPTLTDRHTLAEPQTAGALAVFPVVARPGGLRYRTFVQAAELGAFVTELPTGADVRSLVVHNPTELPLLVYEGEEVVGAQQNRTFDETMLLAAGERTRVAVSCVEAGRWDGSRRGDPMRPSPQVADPELRYLARRTAIAGRADQREVWAAVDHALRRCGVSSPSAAMSDLYEARRDGLAQLTRSIRPIPNQLGALAAVAGRAVALDLVSRPDAFASLLPRLAQGYALAALGVPAADPEPLPAGELLDAALDAPRASRSTAGAGRGFELTGPGVLGAGLERDGELIALSAFAA